MDDSDELWTPEMAHADRVGHCLYAFVEARSGDASDLSSAVDTLTFAFGDKNRLRLDEEHRDDLLRAITWAQLTALGRLPAWCDRSHIALGFAAVVWLVVAWAGERPREREGRRQALAYARVLQNLAHTASLLGELEHPPVSCGVGLAAAA